MLQTIETSNLSVEYLTLLHMPCKSLVACACGHWKRTGPLELKGLEARSSPLPARQQIPGALLRGGCARPIHTRFLTLNLSKIDLQANRVYDLPRERRGYGAGGDQED